MKITFIDKEHRTNFKKMMQFSNADLSDRERVSLFYILSSIDKFREFPERYYDFKTEMIDVSNIDCTLTDGEQALLQLAFHLFTGSNEYTATPVSTFGLLGFEWSFIALNAIKLRFGIEEMDKMSTIEIDLK